MAATLLVPASPAQADVLDVTCVSSTTITYEPPLTATPQDVTASRTVLHGPCLSTTVPGLSSGMTTATFPVEDRSCADLLGSGTQTFTIRWNTGQTSTLTANTTATVVGGLYVVTLTGIVTAGLFQGDTVVGTSQAPATDILLCLVGLGTVSTISTIGEVVFTSL